MKFKINGFTLAEVLIVILIIGVIAAMTLPVLSHRIRERETATKLETVYSILSQAFKQAEFHQGAPELLPLSNASYQKDDSEIIAKWILPEMIVSKDCGTKTDTDCFYGGRYKYLNGKPAGLYGGGGLYKVVLNNGTSLSFGKWSESELIDFFVDTNGVKPPNIIGIDLFTFAWIKDKGLFPLGSPEIMYSCNKASDGWGCTYNVIKYKNMNYLK